MKFHALSLHANSPETSAAARLTFQVPTQLKHEFTFQAGQYVTLRATVNGQDVRRSYSICSTPALLAAKGLLSVGVKAVEDGTMSPWLQTLQAGTTLQVATPDGRFVVPTDVLSQAAPRVLCIAAGSGITPMLAMIDHHLSQHAGVQFTLLYGNRSSASTLFLEELAALKNRYRARFDMHTIMSRQQSDVPLHNGRLDANKLQAFFEGPLNAVAFDAALVCGPNDLIDVCEQALPSLGVAHVHSERFGSATPRAASPAGTVAKEAAKPLAQLTIVTGGVQHSVPWTNATPMLLDAGLVAGLDLPYACKGGVCCTCRAKVVQGSVKMDKNFTLEADEVAAGFVLTCQCSPTSDAVVVSFDER